VFEDIWGYFCFVVQFLALPKFTCSNDEFTCSNDDLGGINFDELYCIEINFE
jgi:hypothetical protein